MNVMRRAWSTLLVLSFVTLVFLLLSQSRILSGIAIYPFETTGKIYVDSPEVYTRERLVNDRYNQDHWLRNQMKLLDDSRNLLTGTVVEIINVGKSDKSASDIAAQDASAPKLPFNQEFRIRAAVRDTIRQRILENMLDDRHDLTGNSVYALKFDTTVIPGANTHKRAFVRVVLDVAPLFDNRPKTVKSESSLPVKADTDSNCDTPKSSTNDDGAYKDLPRHIKEFYSSELSNIKDNACNELNKPYNLYLKWLESIEFRLNSYISDVCSVRVPGTPTSPEIVEALVRETVANLTGTPDAELFRKAATLILETSKRKTGEARKPETEADDETRTHEEKLILKAMEGFIFKKEQELDRTAEEDAIRKEVKDLIDQAEKDQILKVEENLIRKALEVVLGSDGQVTSLHKLKRDENMKVASIRKTHVEISEPWADYFYLDVPSARVGRCGDQVKQLEVRPLVDTFKLFPNDKKFPDWAEKENEKKSEYIRYAKQMPTPNGYLAYVRSKKGGKAAYRVTKDMIKAYVTLKENSKLPRSNDCSKDDSKDKSPGCTVFIHSGFFNFMDSISDIDAYSYTIFPKNDVVGIISDVRLSAGMSPTGGADSGAGLDFSQAKRQSETSATLVGFGDTGINEDDNKTMVQFGWVIGGQEGTKAMHKSQLALVSVPAWTSDLKVTIRTGWLDRNSKEVKGDEDKDRVLRVQLPPDFEAFDSFVAGNQVRRKPKILDQFFRNDIEFTAGRKAKILIPGFRLWRSTTVTLGAQTANRISVMPNMRGIIAEFDIVDIPTVGIKGNKRSLDCDSNDNETLISELPLRIWTSEGVDVAPHLINIRYPANAGCAT